jgi:hypothetical protein
MDVVAQAQPLSMGWCLECHRNPQKNLRPLDQITNLGWHVEQLPQTDPQLAADVQAHAGGGKNVDQAALGAYLKDKFHIRDPQYMTSCSTCHR